MTPPLRNTRLGPVLAAGLLALPGMTAAQTFNGAGPGATSPFVLLSGERSVEVTATPPGSFTAFLLSQDGSVVATLSGAEWQEIRVPSSGRYLFDVRASGSWTIRVEEPDPMRVQQARGRLDGAEAGRGSQASAAWLGKGLAGGLLLGPIGTAIAVQRAGRSEPTLPATLADRLAREDSNYAEAFQRAYADQWRGSQRAAALIGGITGTAILSFAILQVTVWKEQPRAEGEPPGNGETAFRFPILQFRFTP